MKDQTAQETEALMEQDVQTSTVEESQDEPTSTMSESEMLINRRTGYWTLGIEPGDLKWIRNQCNAKFAFTGPNEAFMLMNCYLGFASAVARYEQMEKSSAETGPIQVQASAIEACAMIINRFEGTGIDSAQRIFRIAMALNQPMMEMKKLDEQIAGLKDQANTADKA
jgi:hypothetical protein